jgi:tight adherence protein B
MMTLSPALVIMIVLCSVLAIEAVRNLSQAQSEESQARTRKRLQKLAASLSPREDAQPSLLREDRNQSSLLNRLIMQLPFADFLSLHLYRSGMRLTLRSFVGLSIALACGGGIVAAAFIPVPNSYLLGAVLGSTPAIQMFARGRKRTRIFEEQFPDALDLVIRALRAGHSFSVCLQMVGEELGDPIGAEFALVANEIKMGIELRTALDNLAFRVGAPDLPFFVVAVLLQQETGSNLAEVLGNLSGLIRDRFQLYGKIRGLTALGRASANLLAVWPFIMVSALYFSNADYIRPLWETSAGHTMMMISTVLLIVGYIICRRMATIEV